MSETKKKQLNDRVLNIYKFAYVVDSYGFKFNPVSDTDMYEIDNILFQTTDETGDLITESRIGKVPMLYHLRYLTQLLSIQKYKNNPIFLEMCEDFCKTIESTYFKHTTPDKIKRILESYNANKWITNIKSLDVPTSAMKFINSAIQNKETENIRVTTQSDVPTIWPSINSLGHLHRPYINPNPNTTAGGRVKSKP